MKSIATVRTIFARILIAVVSATSILIAQPAYTLSDLVYDYEDSELNASQTKGLTVFCPHGTKVISGGAQIFGEDHFAMAPPARIIGLEPDTENGAWFRADAALEETGFPGEPWVLRVHIVCAIPPSQGFHYNKVTTRPSREATQGVRPYCGPDEKLIGFGGRVATDVAPRNVALSVVLPAANLKSVLVAGNEMEGGENRDWSVTAYTVCTAATGGLESVLWGVGPPDESSSFKDSISWCDPPKKLHAIGGAIYPANSGQLVISGLFPLAGGVGGFMSVSEDLNGTDKLWYMSTAAICG